MEPLKYLNYTIVCQEIPDEITLAINISGCPHHCEGCHSPELWEYNGNLLLDDLESIIKSYEDLITCVCLMGGDQNLQEVALACQIIHEHELKTAAYFGCDSCNNNIIQYLDYLKLGHYDAKLGGLENITTNQRLWRINNLNSNFREDITHYLHKRSHN